MKKSNIVCFIIVGFGFLFLVIGSMSLMGGAYLENTNIIYFGIASIIVGVSFYIVLAILFAVKYFKGRKMK